jgi:flagellar biogenesis protein FliO
MPPEAKLAGLILLLVYPAGLAAQAETSNQTVAFSSDAPAPQPDREWVVARQATRAPADSLSKRLSRARNQAGAFALPDPASPAPDGFMADSVRQASYASPAESSGVTSSVKVSAESSAESLEAPPAAENLSKNPADPYPALPPPGSRNPAPAGAPSGRFGGVASLLTVGGSLALVLGLFMIMAWIMRRTVPGAVQALPGEVVEVLGRAALTGRQQVHLVRIGSKLILVSVTPEGAETLTEITDPEEVDRLAGLCRETHPRSASNAFRQVFGQFARQRTESGVAVDGGELDLSGMGFFQPAPREAGEQR